MEKNLFSNYRFLKNILTNGLRKLVVAGTCFEYGMQNGPLSKNMETKPDYLIILPWNLKDEIMEQMAHIREWGCQFVILIPEVRIYQ